MSEVAENERRIMVAVDEGEESMYALSWTLRNLSFDNSKDTLILLYVKTPRPFFSLVDGPIDFMMTADMTAKMDKYSQQVAESVLETATKLCSNIQNVKTKVAYGDPRDMICEMSEKLGVDILVMGSHGHSIIQRAFIGSVSNHCAGNAKCNVLIVKKPK